MKICYQTDAYIPGTTLDMEHHNVVGVIGARLNSSRLPRKHLLNLSGQPLIARVFSRIETIPSINSLILATTIDEYNNDLIDWANIHDKKVFTFSGDVNNLVGRVDAIVRNVNAQIVVYFCGDSPLIEPRTVNNLILDLLNNPQFNLGGLEQPPNGRKYIHEGFSVYRRSAWDTIVANSTIQSQREHVGTAILVCKDQINSSNTKEKSIYSTLNHRLSVDTYADYQFMREIYTYWYESNSPESIVSLPWVIEQLIKNQEIRNINHHVKQRQVNDNILNVLAVVDAGHKTGIGHISRCKKILHALQEYKCASTKLFIQGEVADVSQLQYISHDWVSVYEKIIYEIANYCNRESVDILLFDLSVNNIQLDQLRSYIKNKNVKIVAIDCLEKYQEFIDLMVIPSFYLKSKYSNICQEKLRFGWSYYLVDKPIFKQPWVRGNKIIVMTGGSDVSNLSQKLPILLDNSLSEGSRIIWIQGPYAKPPKLSDRPRLHWEVHRNPKNLIQLIQKSNYAITTYGVTYFELLAYGIPTVLVNSFKSRSVEIDELVAKNISIITDNHCRGVKALIGLMNNESLAQKLSIRSKKMIDFNGAKRISDCIYRLVGYEKSV